MELKLKAIMTSLFLIWLCPNAKGSEDEIYFIDILKEMKEEWMKTYITALYSLCPNLVSPSGADIILGSFPVNPTIQRNKSFCCLMFDCFQPYVRTNNCSGHLHRLQLFRQYLDYLICMDPYKYRDHKTLTIRSAIKNHGLFGHLTVASCPVNASTSEHSLCENVSNDELQSLADTIPVTAEGVHFANRFCASCHSVKNNYVFWDLHIQ
jgi:hypothetical protein